MLRGTTLIGVYSRPLKQLALRGETLSAPCSLAPTDCSLKKRLQKLIPFIVHTYKITLSLE